MELIHDSFIQTGASPAATRQNVFRVVWKQNGEIFDIFSLSAEEAFEHQRRRRAA